MIYFKDRNNSVKKIILFAGMFISMPFFAFAQDTVFSILDTFRNLANRIIPFLMIVAVAIFLWGIVKYIKASGDEEKAKEAKSYIIYGLIGLFVMVTFWGLINILIGTFFPSTSLNAPSVPQLVPY